MKKKVIKTKIAVRNKSKKGTDTLLQDDTEFLPTTEMLIWLEVAIDPSVKTSISAIAKRCAVTYKKILAIHDSKSIIEETTDSEEDDLDNTNADVWRVRWYRWQKKKGFIDWFHIAFGERMKKLEWYFDKVGLEQSKISPKHFEIMQMKLFNFRSKSDVTTDNESLNLENPFDKLSLKEKLKLSKKIGRKL